MLHRLWQCSPKPSRAGKRRPRLTPELLEGRDLLSFFPPVFYDVPPNVIPIAVGDFNNDSVLDLVAVSLSSAEATVNVLLGNSDGTFLDPIPSGVGVGYIALAVGDFNGDGLLDVALGRRQVRENPARLSVLLGNGDGTFQKALDHDANAGLTRLVASDVNQDGITDVVTANSRSRSVSIHLGNGDGTFQDPLHQATPGVAPAVAAADFNGDGLVDLATNESVSLGNGDGTFQKAQSLGRLASSSAFVRTFDANGDGFADLLIGEAPRDRLTLLLGNGDGSFTEAWTSPPLPGLLVGLDVGDFNADRVPDLVATSAESGVVRVFLGQGDGTFSQGAILRLGAGMAWTPVARDFNEDGFDDLAVSTSRNRVAVFLNDTAWTGPGPGGSPSPFVPDFLVTALLKGRQEAVFAFGEPGGLAPALLEWTW